eukprot:jgi/Botrbrau1/10743/Bobra.180_2s0011.2
MGTNRGAVGRFADENGYEAHPAKLQENAVDGRPQLRDGRRRALGDIKNTYDNANLQNNSGKENAIAKKGGVISEQAKRAAQLARDGRVLTRRTAKEAGLIIDPKVLQNQPSLKPKQVLRARVVQTHEVINEAEGPSPSTRSLSSLLLERSLTALLQNQNEKADGEGSEDETDIDSADRGDPLAVVEYCPDIYTYYRRIESKTRASAQYMTSQADINDRMRAILVDWLVEVHLKFKLMPETLHLAVDIIDRFLERKPVTRKNLQLVGVTAMLIASKYEEIWAPELRDFIYISDKAYTREQILQMEKTMLNTLSFNLTVPTAYNFLGRLLKARDIKDNRGIHLATYFAELSLPEYSMIKYSYSMIATAAVYLAGRIVVMDSREGDPFPAALRRHSGLTEKAVKPCAAALLSVAQRAHLNQLQAVYKKYGNSKFSEVAKVQIPALDI